MPPGGGASPPPQMPQPPGGFGYNPRGMDRNFGMQFSQYQQGIQQLQDQIAKMQWMGASPYDIQKAQMELQRMQENYQRNFGAELAKRQRFANQPVTIGVNGHGGGIDPSRQYGLQEFMSLYGPMMGMGGGGGRY